MCTEIESITLDSIWTICQFLELLYLNKQGNLKKFRCSLNLGKNKQCVEKSLPNFKAFMHHVLNHAFYETQIKCKDVMTEEDWCNETFVEVGQFKEHIREFHE